MFLIANAREAIDKANSGEEIVETKKKVKGDLHGGTHIHSPWVYMDLGSERKVNRTVDMAMIVNVPDTYFVIGTAQLYTGVNGTVQYRWDISNALDAESRAGRYIRYQAPAEIREVSDGVMHFSFAIIALAAAVILYLFGHTTWNRDKQVLQLSQGDFLMVFLFCALSATCAAFLMAPTNDIFCRIQYPLIVIPIQLMYAITVGRLWRIHAVISPLLLEHLSKGKTGVVQRLVEAITIVSFQLNNLLSKKENKRRSTIGSAKQQISPFQLGLVVAIFSFPQVVIQIIAVFVQPQERIVVFNEDESIGRATCGNHVPVAGSLVMYSLVMLVLLIIILLVMAHSGRKLPSLFNETHVIYDSTFLSMVILLLGGAVIILTNAPTTSPDVQYLVSLVLILSITLNSACRIILPKLKMVWKGETVVVSKLVTDHHRKQREKGRVENSMKGVSGFDPSETRYNSSFARGMDYDMSQQRGLMQTVHSTSNEVGRGLRSSMASKSSVSSGDLNQSSRRSLDDYRNDASTSAYENIASTVIEEEASAKFDTAGKQMPGHQDRDPTKTSSTELDIESGESGASNSQRTLLAEGASQPMSPVGTAQLLDEPVDRKSNDGHGTDGGYNTDGGTTDNELDLEKAAAAAAGFGPIPGSEDKQVSFSEQRASGFLSKAMAKGLSWRTGGKHHDDHNQHRHSGGQLVDTIAEGVNENDKRREPKKRRKKQLAERIVVTEDETPARRLVLKMLDLQDQLEAVNNKIMSGLAVTQQDWKVITKLTTKLDKTFSEEVEFEWEVERRYEEDLKNVLPTDMAGSGQMKVPATPGKAKTKSKKGKRMAGLTGMSHTQEDPSSLRSFACDDDSHAGGAVHAPFVNRLATLESGNSKFSDEDAETTSV